MLKVLVVDDTAFMRQYLKKVIEVRPDTEVIVAPNGVIALEKIKLYKPEVITLDFEMPNMNGIECLQEITKVSNIPVIMVSAFTSQGAKVTIDALNLGAFDFVCKPNRIDQKGDDFEEILLEKIEGALNYKSKNKGERSKETILVPDENVEKVTKKVIDKNVDYSRIEIVAIGISTGGPSVVRRILSSLPKSFKFPIAIVQHMPVGFTGEFAQRLDEVSQISVKEAADGDILKAGRALIAKGGMHLAIKKESLAAVAKVFEAEKVSGHKPSADVLFESIAKEYKDRALGIIMTGMGADGSKGLLDMKNAGAITWGQNEETCTVYGMPKVAAEIGAVIEVLSIDEIIEKLKELG